MMIVIIGILLIVAFVSLLAAVGRKSPIEHAAHRKTNAVVDEHIVHRTGERAIGDLEQRLRSITDL